MKFFVLILLGFFFSLTLTGQTGRLDSFYVVNLAIREGANSKDFLSHYYILLHDSLIDAHNYFALRATSCYVKDSANRELAYQFLESKYVSLIRKDRGLQFETTKSFGDVLWGARKCYGTFIFTECYRGGFLPIIPALEVVEMEILDLRYLGKPEKVMPKELLRILNR